MTDWDFSSRQSDLRIHPPWLLIALRISPNTDKWNCPIYLFFLWMTQMVRSVLPRWHFPRNPSSTLADWVGCYSGILWHLMLTLIRAQKVLCWTRLAPVLGTRAQWVLEYLSSACMNEWNISFKRQWGAIQGLEAKEWSYQACAPRTNWEQDLHTMNRPRQHWMKKKAYLHFGLGFLELCKLALTSTWPHVGTG